MAANVRRTHLLSRVVLIVFTLTATFAAASVLGVGGTAPPSAPPAGFNQAALTLLASTSGLIVPPIAPDFTTNYTAWVYSDPNNMWCAGCLDFIYQFTNNGPNVNGRYTMSDFSGFSVDASIYVFGVHDPITVSRSGNGSGPVISFNFDQFGDEVQPAETTQLLIIETNALHFTAGVVSAQDGTAGSNVAYQPSAVPEPASLMLMGSGILFVGGFLRRMGSGK